MNRSLLPVTALFSASSLLLVDSAVKGTALLVLAAVAAMVLRRDSAATRHLVWLLAIVTLLLVPVLSAMLPQWRVLPEWADISPEPMVVETSPLSIDGLADRSVEVPHNAAPVEIERPSATAHQPAAELPDSRAALVTPQVIPEPAVQSWTWINALPLVWAMGFLVLILRLMTARWILWNIERQGMVIGASKQSAKATPDPILTALETACLQLGTRRPVTLFIHPDKTIPVVWGILRCRLLLPAMARHWSDEQLRSVLLHELAHIKRHDMIAQLLAQIACALHWFNPLVWLAAWRLCVERERACDDLVLASGVRPSAYAAHLLDIVTGLSPARWTHPCGLAMARKSSIEGRLVGVLSENLNRRSVSVILAVIALAIGVGIAVPVAMVRAVDKAAGEATVVANDDDSPPVQVPRDSTAAFLLSQWQELEGRQTTLSETSLARLRVAIDKWVKQPSARASVARVNALRDWNLERADHPVAEVAAWLDEIAAIHPGPLAFAIHGDTLVGATLSAQRQAVLKFGPVAENGLRAAWSRYPARDTYLLGDVISTSVVIQNVSERTVEFECPHSLENIVTWEAKTDDGRTIETEVMPLTGTFPLFTWQLEPGAVAEIYGRGVVIGESDRREDVNSPSVSTALQAKLGEQVTVHWNLREPAAMTTGEVSFKVVSIENVPVWSTAQAGKWPLAGGVTLEVKQDLVHASDIASTAILTWPRDKAGGTARHVIWLAGDAFANRAPWLLAWERGASVLWTMSGQMQSSLDFHKAMPTPQFLRRIDFSDRENITESTWSYVPDIVPDAIRAQFIRAFLPLATTPRTPAYTKPSVQTSRAEDMRPVTELLNGTWKNRASNNEVRITFPDRATEPVQWRMMFARNEGYEIVKASLSRYDNALDGSVQLTMSRRQPRTPGTATLGRLKRGIGETLLLDIMPHVDFPEYERVTGIVLERASAPGAQVEPVASRNDEQAPAGAWTGTLVTGETSGAAATYDRLPKNKEAQKLFKVWLASARTNGKIPGGALGSLARVVANFIKLNPTDERVPKLTELLKRIDTTRDWTLADAIVLLDDLTAIYPSLVGWLQDEVRFSIGTPIQPGKPLPADLTGATWGQRAANGLHAAWLLEPRAEQYPLGTNLKARILFHNTGKETVVFRTPAWHQYANHQARDANGAGINVTSTYWTTIIPLVTIRLAPGEYAEVEAHGIAIGARNEDEENWAGLRVGAWIEAKEGDEVTFQPAAIVANEDIWTMLKDRRTPVEMWKAIVRERIEREGPMPDGAADREQLIRRVTLDLLGVPPTQEEIATLVADHSPDALAALADRIAPRIAPFAGELPANEITFRVTAADPEAAKKPRVATGPGRYVIGDNVRLVIVRKPDGERRVNEANIRFFSPDPQAEPPGKPHEIKLPDGLLTWAIAWQRGATVLWVAEKGVLRSYDFTNPADVKETRLETDNITDVAEPLREALRPALEGVDNGSSQPAADGVKAGFNLRNSPLPDTVVQSTVFDETQDQWIVEGTVTDADGKPVVDVPVQAHTEYAPAKEIGKTTTDQSGHYRLTFHLDSDTLAKFRGVSVRPMKEGFIDKDVAKSGEFNALLYPGEKPRRPGDEDAPYVGPETFAPGEMRRFADRDLVLNQPGRADFVLMPTGQITGQIVDENGQGIYGCGIAVAVEGQRHFDSVAMTGADENGRFRLTGVPFHKPLLFTASPSGHITENSQSLPEVFTPSQKHDIRVVIPKTARGFGRPKIEQTTSPDGGNPGVG